MNSSTTTMLPAAALHNTNTTTGTASPHAGAAAHVHDPLLEEKRAKIKTSQSGLYQVVFLPRTSSPQKGEASGTTMLQESPATSEADGGSSEDEFTTQQQDGLDFFVEQASVADDDDDMLCADARGSGGYMAVCPYTGLVAEGSTLLQAAESWARIARAALGTSVVIPRYLLTSRKIWYGEDSSGNDVYVVSGTSSAASASSSHSADDSDDSLLVFPDTGVAKTVGSQPPEELALIQTLLMDWRVDCTPIMRFTRDIPVSVAGGRASPESYLKRSVSPTMTPHCINQLITSVNAIHP